MRRRTMLSGVAASVAVLSGCWGGFRATFDVTEVEPATVGDGVPTFSDLSDPIGTAVESALFREGPTGSGDFGVSQSDDDETVLHALATTDYVRSDGDAVGVEGLYYHLEHAFEEYELRLSPVDEASVDEERTAGPDVTRASERTERIFLNAVEAETYRTARVPDEVRTVVEEYEYLTLDADDEADRTYYEAAAESFAPEWTDDGEFGVTMVAPTDVDDARLYALSDLPETYRDGVETALEDGDGATTEGVDREFLDSQYNRAVYRYDDEYYYLDATELA